MDTLSMPRRAALLLLASAPLACGRRRESEDMGAPILGIEFGLIEAPEAFTYSGTALVARDGAPGGLWASVPDLPRPERGLVQVEATGRTLVLALFRAPAGSGLTLSAMSAAQLGLEAAETAHVSVQALRLQPRLRRNDTAF